MILSFTPFLHLFYLSLFLNSLTHILCNDLNYQLFHSLINLINIIKFTLLSKNIFLTSSYSYSKAIFLIVLRHPTLRSLFKSKMNL